MKALIVDDEEEIGLILGRFLKKEGLDVSYVSRIEKARHLLQDEAYGVFFLDLNLPDGTGFDLIPMIRNNCSNAKIIIISAFDGETETTKASEMGVDLFIAKPFTKRQVIEAIADIT